jgi:dTDP-4-amino-4,6-dideoxygalactose transaminase
MTTKPSPDSPPRWVVPLSDVEVDAEIQEAVHAVVDSGWWSMGPRVEEFEEAFASFSGSKHALAVSNGTAALHLALLAAGIGPGDEVIVPSLNFVAAANTIVNVGADPVFCDIVGPGDLNMDASDVELAIGPATKAIVVLHYGGFPCDIARVLQIAQRHDLIVIEDAAHAVGSTVGGRMCGTFGRAGCYSFFANKNLPVGEGGMIVTDDDELAASIRLLRSHGMTTLTWERHKGHAHSYDVIRPGFNFRLDELRAAIGLVQLARLPAGNRARAEIAARYRAGLDGVNGVLMPFATRGEETTLAHHLAVVILPDKTQASVRAFLAERRIQTSVHYPPIHGFSYYSDRNRRQLAVTADVGARLVTLPLFAHLSPEQADLVIDTLLEATAVDLGRRGSFRRD